MRRWFRQARRGLLRRARDRRLPDLDPDAISAELRGVLEVLNRNFHALTGRLDPLSAHTKELVNQSEELLKYAGGQAGGQTLFQEAVGILHRPLTYVDFCGERQQQQFALIRDSAQKTQQILSNQHRMQEALKPLTYMVVLFKIESAQLPVELQDTFVTVASEIQRLRELVDSTFRENIETLRRASETLALVQARLDSDFAAHDRFVKEHRHQIEHAIQTLDTQLTENSRHDIRLRTVSHELDNEVGQLVLALQFQDIIQQKCDHVLHTLSGESGVRRGQRWARLQAGHLEAVATELEQAATTLTGGLQSIESRTTKLDAASIELDQYESMTAAADGMVQKLLDTLHAVTEIINATTRLADESHAAISPVLTLTQNLTSTIGEISINIQHIALNAQVRSVQIGDGSGLEVLAARTADISHELGDLGAATAREIAELTGMLGKLLEILEDFRTRGHAEIDHLRVQGSELETRLHGMRDETLQCMQVVGQRVEEVRATTAETHKQMHDLPAAAETLVRIARELTAFATAVRESEALDEEEQLEAHAETYTMASEHAVHAKVFGQEPVKVEEQHSPELFDEPAPPPAGPQAKPVKAPAPAAPGKTAPAEPAGDFELF